MLTVEEGRLGAMAMATTGALAAAAVGLSALGRARWRDAARRLVRQLESGRLSPR